MKFLFTIILSLFLTSVLAKPEINCSVFLYGQNDNGNCIQAVSRVRKNCGGTKINFVPTQFWFDNNNDMIPELYATIIGNNYVPFTSQHITNFCESMTKCFKYSITQGFTTISVTPHLDDGSTKNQWRNPLVVNPFTKYSNKFSYTEIMITPLVQALRNSIGGAKNIKVYFSMQGEMNFMLWKHPIEFIQLYKNVKTQLPVGSKVGISLNFNKLCGFTECNSKLINVRNAKQLVGVVDFVGLSSYPRVSVPPKGSDFLDAINILEQEFMNIGINLKQVAKQKEIVFSEFGIGGADCNYQMAKTPKDAVKCPYYGIYGKYRASTNPWRNASMKRFVTQYYTTLIKWFSRTKTPYNITQIYIWNVASWDITGIYHDSYSNEGSYSVPEVINVLKNFNNKNIVPK
jgi:hypothetical protein